MFAVEEAVFGQRVCADVDMNCGTRQCLRS